MEGYVVAVFALVCMAIGFLVLCEKTMAALIWILKTLDKRVVRWLNE